MSQRTPALITVLAALAGGVACAQPSSPVLQVASTATLTDLSLEQLREVVVSTVSRSDERLARVAASVYVISADDIRRSGATTLPEALRLAPLLMVARADANQYAISGRGFNNVLANKMLLLIDGRVVYTPLFSGVLWEAQDVMLEDVDRIEVITGPSTAMWGSNAVNALVHVITRSASATQGLAAEAHAGDAERGAAVRFGGTAGPTAWRAYVKSYDRSTTRQADGTAIADSARGVQAGWRADWSRTVATGDGEVADQLSLQGDAYQGRIDQLPHTMERRFSGANVAAHWQRQHDADRQTRVQLILDHTERDQPLAFSDTMDTADLAAQTSFLGGGRHRLVLGGGARHVRDQTSGSPGLAFVPATRGMDWWRLFAQDQVVPFPTLMPTLTATLSASLESGPYTRGDLLPSLRLAWTGAEDAVLWASLSRATRAPSRLDREYFSPAEPVNGVYALAGGPDFRSELSDVLEVGWRAQHGPALSYAATLYHAEHRQLRSLAPTPQGGQWRNDIAGHTQGLEGWVRWRPAAHWRLDGGLVWQQQSLHVAAGAIDLGGLAALGNSPRLQVLVHSAIEFAAGWRWDTDLRHVGALPNPAVPAYTAFDTRLNWVVSPATELSLGVQNLFDPRHPEWGRAGNRAELERAGFLRLRLWY